MNSPVEAMSLDPGDARRPLYYKKFEERVRNFCQRNVEDEFTIIELRAITYDYLNVVYRGLWVADDRYTLHTEKILDLESKYACALLEVNHHRMKAERYRCLWERTTFRRIRAAYNRFISYFQGTQDED